MIYIHHWVMLEDRSEITKLLPDETHILRTTYKKNFPRNQRRATWPIVLPGISRKGKS